jgi:hypothetical protein
VPSQTRRLPRSSAVGLEAVMVEVVTASANSPVLPVGGPSAPGLAVVAARRPSTDRRQAPDGTGGHGCGVAGGEARGEVGSRADPPAPTLAAHVLFAFADPYGVQGDTFTTVMIDLTLIFQPGWSGSRVVTRKCPCRNGNW